MRMLRTCVNALVGLMLLAQGAAVAAAPLTLPVADEPAAAEMPCHETAPSDAATPCPCCDEGCTGMAGCALGHCAAAPMSTFTVAPAPQADVVARVAAPRAAAPPFLLRPPIELHA